MHQRNTTNAGRPDFGALALALLVLVRLLTGPALGLVLVPASNAKAMPVVCGEDLNGDGDAADDGETAECNVSERGWSCPIGAADCEAWETCPLGEFPCNNGACTEAGTCSSSIIEWNEYYCPVNKQQYTDPAECGDNCIEEAACGTADQCPYGDAYPCQGGACSKPGTCSSSTVTWNEYRCPVDGRQYDSSYECGQNCVESAACNTTTTWTCPLGNYACSGGSCTKPGTCSAQDDSTTTYTWQCSLTGTEYGTQNQCQSSCSQTTTTKQYSECSTTTEASPCGFGAENSYANVYWQCPIDGDKTWYRLYAAQNSCNWTLIQQNDGARNQCRQGCYEWVQETETGSCTRIEHTTTNTDYTCSLNGVTYDTGNQCSSNCSQTAACSSSTSTTCPLGNYSCSGGTCSTGRSCTTTTESDTDWTCSLNGVTYQSGNECTSSCYETQACNTVDVCPLGNYACTDGTCEVGRSCVTTNESGEQWLCSLDGANYDTANACTNNCSQTEACLVEATCPLGDFACVAPAGIPEEDRLTLQCSENVCIDLEATPANDLSAPNTMLVDDGARDETGACLDEVRIFEGMTSECRLAGLRTTFSSCCLDTDEVYADGMGQGALLGANYTFSAIDTIWTAASAATTVYTEATAIGFSTEVASSAAQFAFQDTVTSMFSPTTIYISVALYVLSELLEGCNEEDMATSMLKSSDYCHYLGEHCIEEWDLIGCVQEADVYCCYNSELGRIIHEQGRLQLGIDWGTADNPNCRGFEPEELQALDFAQMDLSEYYEGIIPAAQDKVVQKVGNGMTRFLDGIQ